MRSPGQPSARGATSTEVSFDAALWELVAGEAARLGVGVAEYVRDAAVARAAFGVRARAEGPHDLPVEWARVLLGDDADDQGRDSDTRHHILAQARERRGEAIALHGERLQAHRQAEALGSANVILDTAVSIVTDTLERRGFALAAPVVARFRGIEEGTGIEVDVRLQDPRRVEAARAAIADRFGERSRVDVIHVS